MATKRTADAIADAVQVESPWYPKLRKTFAGYDRLRFGPASLRETKDDWLDISDGKSAWPFGNAAATSHSQSPSSSSSSPLPSQSLLVTSEPSPESTSKGSLSQSSEPSRRCLVGPISTTWKGHFLRLTARRPCCLAGAWSVRFLPRVWTSFTIDGSSALLSRPCLVGPISTTWEDIFYDWWLVRLVQLRAQTLMHDRRAGMRGAYATSKHIHRHHLADIR